MLECKWLVRVILFAEFVLSKVDLTVLESLMLSLPTILFTNSIVNHVDIFKIDLTVFYLTLLHILHSSIFMHEHTTFSPFLVGTALVNYTSTHKLHFTLSCRSKYKSVINVTKIH